MDPNWGWLALLFGWIALETAALWTSKDRLQPNTFWIRKFPWVLRAGVLVWLTQHFLFCGSPC